jgi:hypothetical protein
MKALLIALPSGSRMGMFCRFGVLEESLPVAAMVWLKEVWILPVRGFIRAGRESI